MKTNNPSPNNTNTFINRVAQFEKDQKKTAPVSATNPVSTPQGKDFLQIYLEARSAVLQKYPNWKRVEILEMEKTGQTDNRFYDQFIVDLLTEAGEVPSLAIRNRIKGII